MNDTVRRARVSGIPRALAWSVLCAFTLVAGALSVDAAGVPMVAPAVGLVFVWLLDTHRRTRVVDAVAILAVAFVYGTAFSPNVTFTVLSLINLLPAAATVAALRRRCPELWHGETRRPVQRLIQYANFLLATVVTTLLGSVLRTTLGVLLLQEHWQMVWLRWDRGFTAIIAVGSLGLTLAAAQGSGRDGSPRRRLRPRQLVEAVGITLVLLAIVWFCFAARPDVPTSFLIVFVIVWTALRFSPPAVAGQALAAGVATTVLTLLDRGPIAAVDPDDLRAVVAQLFVTVMTVTGMVIAVTRRQLNDSIAQLQESEGTLAVRAAELDLLLGNLSDGVAIIDRAGRFTHANAALRQLFSTGPGASPFDVFDPVSASRYLFHPDGRQLTPEEMPYLRAINGETLTGEELHLRHPSLPGGRVLEFTAVRLPDDGDRQARSMVTIHDATTEKAQRDALTDFAATVAHDLANPLSTADGWAELLETEFATGVPVSQPEGAHLVGSIRASLGRASGFIHALLDHAVARDQALAVEDVDLSELIGQVGSARVHQPSAGTVLVPAHLPHVRVDRALVTQLFDNLIGNGLKYVAPGTHPEVVVSATATDGWVTVHVSDNGIGIADDERVRVFDSFHRAHRDGYAGTGLGLAISKRVVERHGGHIHVEPNPGGVGSCFVLALPTVPPA